jgi:hypothetical protein
VQNRPIAYAESYARIRPCCGIGLPRSACPAIRAPADSCVGRRAGDRVRGDAIARRLR